MEAIKLVYEQRTGEKPVIRKSDSPMDIGKQRVLMVDKNMTAILTNPPLAGKIERDKAAYKQTGNDPKNHRRLRDGIRYATNAEVEWLINETMTTGKMPNKVKSAVEIQQSTVFDKQADVIRDQQETARKQAEMIARLQAQLDAKEAAKDEKDNDYPEGFIPPFPEPKNGGQVGANKKALNKFLAEQEKEVSDA